MPRVSADERRRDLIEAAFRVMARVGVPMATTRLICAEAGVPQSVFHYCFRSKDELFKELTQTVIGSMLGGALDSLVDSETFDVSVRQSLQQLWRTAIEHPDRQLVLYELTTALLREPDTAELAHWQYQRYFDDSRQLLQALADRADMTWTTPIDVLGRMTTTMIDGMILGWLTDHNTDEVSEAVDAFADYLTTQARPKTTRSRRTNGQRRATR